MLCVIIKFGWIISFRYYVVVQDSICIFLYVLSVKIICIIYEESVKYDCYNRVV